MPAVLTRPSAFAPQSAAAVCASRRRRQVKIGALYLLLIAAGLALCFGAYRFFQPAPLTHPDFDPAAAAGLPQVDEQRYGYSALTVDEGYVVKLCGLPGNDGQTLGLCLTNPAENEVWLRAEVRDQEGGLLASTGVLRQGEYLPTVTLSQPLTQRETPVTVRVVAYEPDTWQSRGNVNLNMTLYLNYQ